MGVKSAMTRRLGIGLLLLAWASPAWAVSTTMLKMPCWPTEALSHALQMHGKERKGYEVLNDGSAVVFWAGRKGWTMVVTLPTGISCLMVGGKRWQGVMPGGRKI